LFQGFDEENCMAQAQDLLRSGGEQTLRLAADLAAPLVLGLRRLGRGVRRRLNTGLARSWSRDAARNAGRVLPLILLGLGLGVGTGVLLYRNGPPVAVRNQPAAAEPLPAGPVKIVDAAPRSASCEDQVWPYIEQRCLKRAPAAALSVASAPEVPAPPAAVAAPPQTPPAPDADASAASAGTTPPVSVAADPAAAEVDANGAPMQRLATAAPAMDGEAAALAGAGAAAGLAAWQLAERRAEPRRRSARRAGYSRRPAMSFRVFGLRF
jgi:hypothetical protein